jgi:hypothetical protein
VGAILGYLSVLRMDSTKQGYALAYSLAILDYTSICIEEVQVLWNVLAADL